MRPFQNKVIWITGVSSGYGEALARAFSAQGAGLVLSARRNDRLDAIAGELQEAVSLPLDLEYEASFADATRTAIAAFGHVDLQVHAGALAQSGSALETCPDVARRIMQVDYFGCTELTRQLLPHVLERGQGQSGAVSGLLAALTLPGRSSYAAAKAALSGCFACLRAELFGRDIDITLLVSGALQTDLTTKALGSDGQPRGGQASGTGCPLEVAVRQSLKVIADREYEACIGLRDESFMLWRISRCAPALGAELLLNKLRSPWQATQQVFQRKGVGRDVWQSTAWRGLLVPRPRFIQFTQIRIASKDERIGLLNVLPCARCLNPERNPGRARGPDESVCRPV